MTEAQSRTRPTPDRRSRGERLRKLIPLSTVLFADVRPERHLSYARSSAPRADPDRSRLPADAGQMVISNPDVVARPIAGPAPVPQQRARA